MSLISLPAMPVRLPISRTKKSLRTIGAELLLGGFGAVAILALLVAGLSANWLTGSRK